MEIICVSGKSGSGKSLFAKHLAQKLDGLYVNVDEISHLSLKDENIKNQFIQKFGKIILNNNEIDTKQLGQIVFKDSNALDFINNICWQYIDDKIDEIINLNKQPYIILDYALIVKMKYFSKSKYKFLITSDTQTRFSRLISRDNVSIEYIMSRDNNSLNYNENEFDFSITNDSSKETLLKQAEEFASFINTRQN